jgi:hypothetical protein
MVPIDFHYVRGRIKLEIGLAKGKKQHDKRDAEKDRDWKERTTAVTSPEPLTTTTTEGYTALVSRGERYLDARAAPRRKRKTRPNLRFENEAGCIVCGVDEVGCAPLAGRSSPLR